MLAAAAAAAAAVAGIREAVAADVLAAADLAAADDDSGTVAAAVAGMHWMAVATASVAVDPWHLTGSRNPCLEPMGDSGPADLAAPTSRKTESTGEQFSNFHKL